MTTAMVHQPPSTEQMQHLMPAFTTAQAKQRYEQIVSFVQGLMEPGRDFGTVPGTGSKPTLLKPGAEKLTTFFGLTKRFLIVEKIEDWTGAAHNGEPFFYYLYRCQLYRGDMLIAESDGSCNSFESKYRWRQGERKCPACGKPTIIKGKAEYGGGWLCFAKKGGCGGKFPNGDRTIEDQNVGRVPNPDVADQVNTLQKMSQKRALIAATLLAVNASEFFTQDLDDLVVEGEFEEVRQPANGNGGRHEERQESSPNGSPTEFWSKVKKLGLKAAEVESIAKRAQSGEISWADAAAMIEQ